MRLFFTSALFLFIACSSPREKARTSLELGDYERAIRLYSKILDASPRDFDARYGLGLALYQKAYAIQGRGETSVEIWQKSIEELTVASRVNRTSILEQNLANANYRLAIVYEELGKLRQAKTYLTTALSYNPGHQPALHRLGTLCYESGDFQKSRLLFRRVLDQDPTFVAAYQNLGSSLWALGKIEEAAAIWRAGLKVDPNNKFMKVWVRKAERKQR